MSTLSLPAGARPTLSRNVSDASTRSVRRVEKDDSLTPLTRSRRNSESSINNEAIVAAAVPTSPAEIPQQTKSAQRDKSSDSRLIPTGAVEQFVSSMHTNATTTLHAGASVKPFTIHTELLRSKSPYFRRLLAENPSPAPEQLTFPDVDEYAFALFVRWAYGGKLHGPTDFHTMQHYVGLYVIALGLEVEGLQNNVMDLVRQYYRAEGMTAPAYRLEYIYTYTHGRNHMRNFLVTTAAYRAMCEKPAEAGLFLTDSIRGVIAKGGDLATDFAEACIKLHRNGTVDVRRGNDCVFHEHADGKRCKVPLAEAWQSE